MYINGENQMIQVAEKTEPWNERMATLRKKLGMPTIEQEVAALLKAPTGVSAEEIGSVIASAKTFAADAEDAGRAARLKSVDPQCVDGVAERGRAEDFEFTAQRLRNAISALEPHHQAAIKREERERFSAEAAVIERKITDLAKEMATAYPAAVNQLVGLFQRIAASDKEAADFNKRAPAGFYLRGVEASIAGGAKIIEKIKLPVSTERGVVEAWPPRNNWAADYAESVRAGIVNAGPAPTEAERAAEGERVIAYAAEMERGRMQLNEQAEARSRGIAAGG
jgi:hypothetical protein